MADQSKSDELEALRSRVVALQDECVELRARAEALEGDAADWQELAETTDRKLVEAQRKLRKWEQWPAELRHALGHVVTCEDNCALCRQIAADALTTHSPLE